VRVKNENELVEYFGDKAFTKYEIQDKDLTGFGNLSGLVSKQFSNLFNSYTKAFNKINNRKGGLFMRPFNRLKVTNDQYLVKLVHYIHYNPVEAGICDKQKKWKFSSYPALISNSKTNLLREELLSWFHDLDNFIFCHQQEPTLTGIE
jgi:hypothetical protein